MAEELRIPSAHEHTLERQAHHGHTLSQWVAILSALLACLAAVISYQSTTKENQAILMKNEAIMRTTETADAWAEYQAVRVKAHIMEVAIATSTNRPDLEKRFKAELERYNTYSEPLQKKALAYQLESKLADQAAKQILKPHEQFAQSMTLLQIAISLASIAALTRKRWLLGLSLVSAAGGAGLAAMGWLA